MTMRRRWQNIFVLIILICCAAARPIYAAQPSPDLPLTQYVNLFIGTAPGTDKFDFYGNSGDVFPGALWPRGMLQWSPDTPAKLPGGYNYPDTQIKDFSLTHFSGRGCTCFQDFPFMPVVGDISVSPYSSPKTYYASFSHSNEIAHPGYYKVQLDNGIATELTTTMHTGMARFTFPTGSDGTILINSGGSINGDVDPTSISISNDNEISGKATTTVGCGNGKYTIYFVARFDQPFSAYGTWNGAAVTASSRSAVGPEGGAYFTFDTTKTPSVLVKTAISYVSIDNAHANLVAENPDWDFAKVAAKTDTAWNHVLNRIRVQGGSTPDMTVFYTALYHSFIHANVFSDVNGEYMGFDSKVHTVTRGHFHYENIPTWDQYRTLQPLQAVLAPDETSDVIQSLIDDAAQGGGGLPRWEQKDRNSSGMVGDSPSALISEDYALGARSFDTAAAYKAMLMDASDPNARSDGHVIREGMSDYLTKGYIPGTSYNSAATTLEYGIDDFALSQYAKAMGDTDKSAYFLRQAQSWKNLLDSNAYIHPRQSSGAYLEPFRTSADDGFVEGSGAQYNWLVQFNLQGLFGSMGGNDAAIARLDNFFTKLNDGPRSDYAFMGNEPCSEVPWEYIWAGAPSKTEGVLRRVQNELFTDQPNGMPGNDDAGATSSFYIWSAIGIDPVIPGVAGVAVGSPRFAHITLCPTSGAHIDIESLNCANSEPYVQSLTINGKPWEGAWIPWDKLKDGAALKFVLGDTPSSWGTHPTIAPPSFDAAPNVTTPVPAPTQSN